VVGHGRVIRVPLPPSASPPPPPRRLRLVIESVQDLVQNAAAYCASAGDCARHVRRHESRSRSLDRGRVPLGCGSKEEGRGIGAALCLRGAFLARPEIGTSASGAPSSRRFRWKSRAEYSRRMS